jgi:hypothetical protein
MKRRRKKRTPTPRKPRRRRSNVPLTAEQYRTAIDTQRTLVERGWHPAVAGAMVVRAVDRVLCAPP